jgi:hypothetical protein
VCLAEGVYFFNEDRLYAVAVMDTVMQLYLYGTKLTNAFSALYKAPAELAERSNTTKPVHSREHVRAFISFVAQVCH